MPDTNIRRNNRSAKPADHHVGARIRELRQAQGLSLTELASQLGLSHQQLQKYETGANRISAGMLHLLSKTLAVPMEEFFIGLDRDNSKENAAVELARSRCFVLINDTHSLGQLTLMARLLRAVTLQDQMRAKTPPADS